ncbi:VOC family protein [Pseudomonas sp. MOB-449]|nr:VOC family protein [Pseudomonas sp. MOB-449]
MNQKQAIAGLGKVMQLAWVPRDFEAALDYWTRTMGVGPFFELPHIQTERTHYRGAPVDLDFSVAIAYWGDLQIELIRQHNRAPSIYQTWLDAGREGLHHVCLQVDMARARALCQEQGAEVMQEVWLPGGGEAIYVDAGGELIEMIDFPAEQYGFFEVMKQAALDWDGADPLRVVG